MPPVTNPWSADEEAQLRDAPYDYSAFELRFPGQRTRKAFQVKRAMLGLAQGKALVPRDEDDAVLWDKNTDIATWDDYLVPMEGMQALGERASASQDHASIAIPSDRDIPIAFISDWHIGSWGVDARAIRQQTEKLCQLHDAHGLYVAVLGDMIEMAIRLRSVIEIGGNLLRPRDQMSFLKSWLGKMAPLILWSTWDNHAVQREEDLSGVSLYAELFKAVTIYHSGLGHTDLTVGDETYTIATSHRFRGRSQINPLAAQMNYIQREAPDREVAIAGDSHIPAIMQYVYGQKVRTVANCGTLQTNSGYSKRFFSLYASTAMPILVFSPDTHCVNAYHSIEHYERSLRLDR
jgi:hypothetical protein